MFSRIALAVTVAAFSNAATAQESFPNRTVTVVVGYSPGGSNDKMGRFIADALSDAWGESVIVENRPGAGGAIAAAHVTQQPADGHTLMVGPVTLTMIPAVQTNLPYDLNEDFTPVAMLGRVPMILAVGPSVGADSMEEFLEVARSRDLFSAITGPGAIDDFASELLMKGADITVEPVIYSGGTEAMIDVIGGHADLYFGSLTQLMEQVRAGKLTALAVTSDERSATLPDVPTLAEAGVEGVDVQQWWGIFARSDTPPEIVEKINADINAALETEEAEKFFSTDGAEPVPMSPAEFATFVDKEYEKWQSVAQDAGMKVE